MPDHFEDMYFPTDPFYVGDVNDFLLFKDFDGNLLLRGLMNGKFNFTEGALP